MADQPRKRKTNGGSARKGVPERVCQTRRQTQKQPLKEEGAQKLNPGTHKKLAQPAAAILTVRSFPSFLTTPICKLHDLFVVIEPQNNCLPPSNKIFVSFVSNADLFVVIEP